MAARGTRSSAPAQITLAPIVLIKGSEGLLVDRALDRLRALAHEADPNLERTDINAATYQAGQIDVIASPSLFGESRMVIIRDLETMSDALAADLIAYAGAPAPDVWMFLAHPGGNARGKKVIDTITKAKWPVIPADPLKNDRDQLARLGLGLEDRMTSRAGLLSGGQRQALTLLMASLVKPRLLLLDEHTAALDPGTAARVLELSDQIVSEGRLTTLMVTHNMRDAIEHGNRLIMMNEGRIVLDISGEEKKRLTVDSLLARFSRAAGEDMLTDRVLIGA